MGLLNIDLSSLSGGAGAATTPSGLSANDVATRVGIGLAAIDRSAAALVTRAAGESAGACFGVAATASPARALAAGLSIATADRSTAAGQAEVGAAVYATLHGFCSGYQTARSLSNPGVVVRGLPKGNVVTNALLIKDVLTTFGPPMDEALRARAETGCPVGEAYVSAANEVMQAISNNQDIGDKMTDPANVGFGEA